MERIKNFFYDKNDLLIALIVVVVALFIITNRVEAIMAYPEHLAQIQAEQSKEAAEANQVAPASNADKFRPDKNSTSSAFAAANEGRITGGALDQNATGAGITSPPTAQPASGQTAAPGQTAPPPTQKPNGSPSSLYIQNGDSWASVSTKLLNAGLISSKEDFMSAVTASHKENRLQVGNFTIPAGSDSAQIVAIITR